MGGEDGVKYTRPSMSNSGVASIDQWGDNIIINQDTNEVEFEEVPVTYADQIPPCSRIAA